jgi:hypothetical protein
MNFIENVLANHNIKDLDQKQFNKLQDKTTDLIAAYNIFVEKYNSVAKNQFEGNNLQPLRLFGYKIRE